MWGNPLNLIIPFFPVRVPLIREAPILIWGSPQANQELVEGKFWRGEQGRAQERYGVMEGFRVEGLG